MLQQRTSLPRLRVLLLWPQVQESNHNRTQPKHLPKQSLLLHKHKPLLVLPRLPPKVLLRVVALA
jgi:hypothetical protein